MSSISVFVFSSQTCEPCKHVKPVWTELAEDYSDFNWQSVDINNDPHGYAKYFKVENIPSMVVMNGEYLLGTHKGTSMMGYLYLLKQAKQATASATKPSQ